MQEGSHERQKKIIGYGAENSS